MKNNNSHHSDKNVAPDDKTFQRIWSIFYGIWMVWFLLSWASVLVAIFGGVWETPMWSWLASALAATGVRWLMSLSEKKQ